MAEDMEKIKADSITRMITEANLAPHDDVLITGPRIMDLLSKLYEDVKFHGQVWAIDASERRCGHMINAFWEKRHLEVEQANFVEWCQGTDPIFGRVIIDGPTDPEQIYEGAGMLYPGGKLVVAMSQEKQSDEFEQWLAESEATARAVYSRRGPTAKEIVASRQTSLF